MAAEKKKSSLTSLGLVFGVVAGVLAAGILFSFTHDPIYYILVGIGAAFGLAVGAMAERKERTG